MHGVPKDLPVNLFVNASLMQICLGQYQIQFHFMPERYIGVEGRWELKDEQGNTVDTALPHEQRVLQDPHTLGSDRHPLRNRPAGFLYALFQEWLLFDSLRRLWGV
jgi:hypothetical protein